jgi:hypothetical protein
MWSRAGDQPMPQYLISASIPSGLVVSHTAKSNASLGCRLLARIAVLDPPSAVEPEPVGHLGIGATRHLPLPLPIVSTRASPQDAPVSAAIWPLPAAAVQPGLYGS